MDLQTAIERAKSALGHRVFVNETVMLPRAREGSPGTVLNALENELHLDTEALQTLREWKPEEKGMSPYRRVTRTIATDGTEYIYEYEPGVSVPVRTTIVPPHGERQVIDHFPDYPDSTPTGEGREE